MRRGGEVADTGRHDKVREGSRGGGSDSGCGWVFRDDQHRADDADAETADDQGLAGGGAALGDKSVSDLFNNSVLSMKLGLEDYETKDPIRILSAIRNLHAGILLLAKEVLVRHVPKVDARDILATGYKPVPDDSGGIKYVPQSNTTINLQDISARFKGFGLTINSKSLGALVKIRNDIEHLAPQSNTDTMRRAIYEALPVANTLFRQAKVDPKDVLEEAWDTMLTVRSVYDQELSVCRGTFADVKWECDLLDDVDLICVKCGSGLVAQDDPKNSDPYEICATCRSCGSRTRASDVVKQSVSSHFEGIYYETCPECSETSYTEDYGCIFCGLVLGECEYCGENLTTNSVDPDHHKNCLYCGHLMYG